MTTNDNALAATLSIQTSIIVSVLGQYLRGTESFNAAPLMIPYSDFLSTNQCRLSFVKILPCLSLPHIEHGSARATSCPSPWLNHEVGAGNVGGATGGHGMLVLR